MLAPRKGRFVTESRIVPSKTPWVDWAGAGAQAIIAEIAASAGSRGKIGMTRLKQGRLVQGTTILP